jgi:hypothetical protein
MRWLPVLRAIGTLLPRVRVLIAEQLERTEVDGHHPCVSLLEASPFLARVCAGWPGIVAEASLEAPVATVIAEHPSAASLTIW